TGEFGLIAPEALDLQSILDVYYIAPIDATLNYETYDVIDSVDGYGFDLALAQQKLDEADYGATIEIPFTVISPEVTTESLKAAFYKDVLATYTAKYDSDENRDTNLHLACKAINGVVLFPGEAFSYNEALGERTEARGYKPGPSFSGGKTVDTIGGGICQVSSALYYCAMKADMGIGQRTNHGYAVSYVPLGMDAAVSWDTLDFTFVNTSNYPIRIEASSDKGNVTVSIVGTDDKDYYIEMLYEVLSTETYETVYKSYPSDNPEGYTSGMYLMEPHTGYSIQTYRCKYDKATNNLISQVVEAASYYAKSDAVICIIEDEATEPTQGIGNGNVTEADGALH
ncbi:MAG: VanW family protein, partial [Oscillospiraceae bacterium]|nr:VanW family protein [Oscillospiraceae bacterium]